MTIGAIVQARTSSTRLPGKVLKALPHGSATTVLGQVISRLKQARRLDKIIIATTKNRRDDKIVKIAKKANVKYFRGSESDVLSRYYLCAKKNSLDIIVRITSDCPCTDPAVVDAAIAKHLKSGAEYTSNTLERTYPHGLDVEVFNMDVLELAHEKAKKKYEREHVTPYIYTTPGRFKIIQIRAQPGFRDPSIRITLDTGEDYALLCALFECLYKKKKYFNSRDIVKLFKEKPWLRLINNNVIQKKLPVNK